VRVETAQEAGRRIDVADDVVRVGCFRHAGRLPVLPGRAQEVDETDVVHGKEGVVRVGESLDDGSACLH
jgi:hypothetical protein